MEQTEISAEKKALYKHLSFYLHEQRKWERAVLRRSLLSLILLGGTMASFYGQKPLMAMGGTCAAATGLISLKKANFYRRRSAYRVRQQKFALENN